MNRISTLASLTKGSNIICDVGCDHGYTIIEALKYHGVKKAIAIDVAVKPLESARLNALNYNLDDRIDFILSDGLDKLDKDFDTLIISGMGGNLIKDILASGINKLKKKKIIVEANNHSELVRGFLNQRGFKITNEIALYDKNKYYEIIVFEEGNENLTDLELSYGPILLKIKNEAFVNHLEKRLETIANILKSVNDSKKKSILEKEALEIRGIIHEA